MSMEIIEALLEKTRFLGKHKAIVFDIEDPKKLRRVRVKCPSVAGDVPLNWALPCDSKKSDWLPVIGDVVWIEFEGGADLDTPIFVGLAVAKDDVDQDFLDNYNSNYRKDRDPNGNQVEWKPEGFKVKDKNGNEVETTDQGMLIKDINGNEILMSPAGIKLKTGDASVWTPCIVQNCIFSGAPHGGVAGGIAKLTGE